MPALKNPRHEAFARALARGMSATAAYAEAGYKANTGNASTLKADQSISQRVAELQDQQVALHQHATAAAAANAQVTIESLICRSRGCSRQGYVREGRRCRRRERADGEGQAGRHVARESGPAQYW